jgi:hypothetical protein
MNPNDFFNYFSTSDSMEIKKGRMEINILLKIPHCRMSSILDLCDGETCANL